VYEDWRLTSYSAISRAFTGDVQGGQEFSAARAEHLAIEETAPAGNPLTSPRATGRKLRYEWRARLLKKQGVIEEIITRDDHLIPTVQGLLAHRSVPFEAMAKG
jgi:hypothetical protein